MSHKMNLISVAVVTMCVGLVYGQSSPCFTPDGTSGECIQIHRCEHVLKLINKPNKTDRDFIVLKRSHCGIQAGVHKVCCPKLIRSEPVHRINGPCYTPDGSMGTCINLNSCSQITNLLRPPLLQQNIDFVRKSRCNSPDEHTVCCGSSPEGVPSVDCQTKMTAFPPDPRSECCGVTAGIGNKIFGGTETALDEHPWAVVIEYIHKRLATTGLYCGGALISGKYVLTAAHCLTGPLVVDITPTTVRLGEYDTGNEGKDCVHYIPGRGEDCTDGVTRIAIERSIPHTRYNRAISRADDIGLIRLKETAPYTDFIRPICLPIKDLTRPENTPPVFWMVAAGWGATEAKRNSNVKAQVILPFVSLDKCQRLLKNGLRRSQLCAGGVNLEDTCEGDSGGPLMFEDQNKFRLIGVVSYGITPCGQDGVPAVYSNVYEYLDWIKSVIVP